MITQPNKVIRAVLAGILAAYVAIGLSACDSTSGDEKGTTVEDVQEEDAGTAYDGVYDSAFYADMDSYEGEVVTLSADVNTVVSDHAFTIAGGDVEELLIVSADKTTDLEKGSVVKVTGTVHTAFDLTAVEDQVGVDLDDAVFDPWGQEPYVVATSIDTNPDTEGK